MKELYCDECGILVASLSSGSTLKKGTKLICSECNGFYFSDSTNDCTDNSNGNDALEQLKKIIGL